MRKKSIGRPPNKETKQIWMKSTTARKLERMSRQLGWYQGTVVDRALKLLSDQHSV